MRLPANRVLIRAPWARWAIFALVAAFVFYRLGSTSLFAATANGFDLSDSLVPAAQIHHGGPPRDGIPAIDHPRFISATRADFLTADDRVLGMQRNGETKAYPVRILNYHEIVNDHFGDEAVVITYCPLCGSGMAFMSSSAGRSLSFGVSGLLYNSDMLLYDRQTQSLWSQLMRQAISGPLRGRRLRQVVMEHTTWADWSRRHPDTLVLSTRTGYRRDYRVSPYPGYAGSDAVYFPVSTTDRRYHPKEQVIGLSLNGVDKAYPFSELSRGPGELSDSVAGTPVRVVYDVASRSGRVFGPHGEVLPTTVSYWFAWIAFHPRTEVYRAR